MISVSTKTVASREVALQKLFSPIVQSRNIQVFGRRRHTQLTFGLGPASFGGSLRDARHTTRVRGVFLNYFEIWNSLQGGRTFSLEKAYLHLDIPRSDGTGDDELVAFHCDPSISQAEPSYIYRRGPHLHFPLERYDLNKSHIALCLQNLEQTCTRFDSFSKAFWIR